MMRDIKPSAKVNVHRIPMICPECEYRYPLFKQSCPECPSHLIPAELYIFVQFKKIMKEIESQDYCSPTIIMELMQESHGSEDFGQDLLFQSILFYYQNFVLHKITTYMKKYRKNLAILSQADCLFEYIDEFRQANVYLSQAIRRYEKETQNYEEIDVTFTNLDKAKLLRYILQLEKAIQKKTLQKKKDHKEHILRDNLIQSMLNSLSSEFGLTALDERNEGENTLRKELNHQIAEFITREEEMFFAIKQKYHLLCDHRKFQELIQIYGLELLYLPQNDKYVLIKPKYRPPMERLAELSQEGGLKLMELSSNLNITLTEAELIIQLLLRKNLLIKVSSYLKGEQYYIN